MRIKFFIALITTAFTQAATAGQVDCSDGNMNEVKQVRLLDDGVVEYKGIKSYGFSKFSLVLKCEGVSGGGYDWFNKTEHRCKSSDGHNFTIETRKFYRYGAVNAYTIWIRTFDAEGLNFGSPCSFTK